MNKTTFFLIFLLAPLALTQQDILSMIDKSPEGKNLLDNLFLQTKLMGDLDVTTVRKFLSANRDKIEEERKSLDAYNTARIAECDQDEKGLTELLKDHHERQFVIKRGVESSKRTTKRAETFVARAAEELDNYKKFEMFVSEGIEAWKAYFTAAVANFDKVSGILKGAVQAVKGTNTAASFVELSEDYHTNLAEMKMQVGNVDLQFTGMAPIINNLLEIMADPSAAGKPEVRNAVRALSEALLETIRDKVEELEEQNEHQMALFDNLIKSYHDNSDRSQKQVDVLTETLKGLNARLTTVSNAYDHAVALSAKVEKVLTLRTQECEFYQHNHEAVAINHSKSNAVINQIEEILVNKSAGIKTFFLQREMTRK